MYGTCHTVLITFWTHILHRQILQIQFDWLNARRCHYCRRRVESGRTESRRDVSCLVWNEFLKPYWKRCRFQNLSMQTRAYTLTSGIKTHRLQIHRSMLLRLSHSQWPIHSYIHAHQAKNTHTHTLKKKSIKFHAYHSRDNAISMSSEFRMWLRLRDTLCIGALVCVCVLLWYKPMSHFKWKNLILTTTRRKKLKYIAGECSIYFRYLWYFIMRIGGEGKKMNKFHGNDAFSIFSLK